MKDMSYIECPKCGYPNAIEEILIKFDGTAYRKIICAKCMFRQTEEIEQGD